MNQLTIVFTDAHVNSMEELAKIISSDWPAIMIRTERENSETKVYTSLHNCLDCDRIILHEAVNTLIHIGKHRVKLRS